MALPDLAKIVHFWYLVGSRPRRGTFLVVVSLLNNDFREVIIIDKFIAGLALALTFSGFAAFAQVPAGGNPSGGEVARSSAYNPPVPASTSNTKGEFKCSKNHSEVSVTGKDSNKLTNIAQGSSDNTVEEDDIGVIRHKIKMVAGSVRKEQESIKGFVYILTEFGNNTVVVDPPNIFGSVVKIGLPPPEGTITLYEYKPPPKSYIKFCAEELNNHTELLVRDAAKLPDRLDNTGVSKYISLLKTSVSDLQSHDLIIQQIVASQLYEPRRSSLAVGKQVLVINTEIDNLKLLLKRTKRELNRHENDISEVRTANGTIQHIQ